MKRSRLHGKIRHMLPSILRSPYLKYVVGYTLCSMLIFGIFGCATTDETTNIRTGMDSFYLEFNQFRTETNTRLLSLSRDNELMGKQVINIASANDSREDKTRSILGKLDELEHQLLAYWNETKNEIAALKKTTIKHQPEPQAQFPPVAPEPSEKPDDENYEALYKDAFDAFQRGSYQEAIGKFSDFVVLYPKAPLAPNAYFWIGESYGQLKNNEKAILTFQEIIEKYPKSNKVPGAMLAQADAFYNTDDKKSSMTILKKIMELYPKTEEAAIAERRLKNLGL